MSSTEPDRQRRRAAVLSLFLMVATTLAFSWPALQDHRVLAAIDYVTASPPYDQYDGFGPEVLTLAQSDHATQIVFPLEFWSAARSGDLQHWEPDLGGGVPLATAIYNRVLSPFYVTTYSWLSPRWAVNVSLMLMILVSQLGVWWLARRLGLRAGPATVAAVAYGFSGASISLLLRIQEVHWFPVVLALAHGVVTNEPHRVLWRFGLGIATTFLWFCGFPGGAVFAFGGVAIATVAVAALADRSRMERARAVAVAAGVGLAGTMVAAVQLLPTARFLGVTNALERTYEAEAFIGLARLAEAVSPRFFGTFHDGTWWWKSSMGGIGSGNMVQAGTAFGAVVLLGVMAAALLRPRQPEHRPAAVLGAVLVVAGFSFAYFGGPVLWLLQRLPLLDELNPARSRFIAALGIALLAGVGVQRLVDWVVTRAEAPESTPGARPALDLVTRAVAGAVIVAIAAAFVRGLQLAGPAMVRGDTFDNLRLPVAMLILTLALAVVASRAAVRFPAVLAALPFLVALVAAVELLVGHAGHHPAPDEPLYPLVAAFDDLDADARFITTGTQPMFVHMTVPLDLPDARTIWPGTARYEQLLGLTDPAMASGSARNAVTLGVPGAAFDPFHPALDRLSVRDVITGVGMQPWDLVDEEPVAHLALDGRVRFDLPVVTDVATAWRGVKFDILGAECAGRRDVIASVGGVDVARWRRDIAAPERMRLALPDLRTGSLELRITGCELRVDRLAVELGSRERVTLEQVEGWQRYGNVGARPLLEIVTDVEVVPDSEARLVRLGRPSGLTLVEVAPPFSLGTSASVVARRTEPDGATFEVDATDGGALVVIRQNLAPGWKVTVDDVPVDVVFVDHAFQGVWVPEGEHVVATAYAPDGFREGAIVAAMGLLLLYGLCLATVRRPPTPRGAATADGG